MNIPKKTLEELISVVKSTDDRLVQADEFTEFKNYVGLYDSGAPWTPANLLYYIYLEWKNSLGEQHKALSPRKFGVIVKSFYKHKRSNQGILYKVTCNRIEDLTNEEKEEAVKKIKEIYKV